MVRKLSGVSVIAFLAAGCAQVAPAGYVGPSQQAAARDPEIQKYSSEIEPIMELWRSCVRDEALRLGRMSEENAETVVRAADAICFQRHSGELSSMRLSLELSNIRQARITGLLRPPEVIQANINSFMSSFREGTRDRALANLIEMRIASE